MRCRGCRWSVATRVAVLLVVLSAPVGAVTPEALTGDYTLVALDIDYGAGIQYPFPIDEDNFPGLNGYFSATATALVFEHAGQDDKNNSSYRDFVAGTYSVTGNMATVTRAAGMAVDVQIVMPNADTVDVSGVGIDGNNRPYNYTYRFTRDETYYTQAALDAAVAEATAGLLSPAACDQMIADAVAEATAGLLSPETCGQMIDDAVADALANVEPVRVPVVIPIGD